MSELNEFEEAEELSVTGNDDFKNAAVPARMIAAPPAARPDHFLDADVPGALRPEQAAGLTYRGEDKYFYFVTDRAGTRLRLAKNRSAVDISDQTPASEFDPVFQVLLLGFVGLAPAGLGAIVLVPLALLWTIGLAIRRPLTAAGRIRMAVVWGIGTVLLALAVPMSLHFLSGIG
jgi:hypothetical protein